MAVCLKTKVPIDLDEVDAGGTLVERVCDISIFRGACVACRLVQQLKCSIRLSAKPKNYMQAHLLGRNVLS